LAGTEAFPPEVSFTGKTEQTRSILKPTKPGNKGTSVSAGTSGTAGSSSSAGETDFRGDTGSATVRAVSAEIAAAFKFLVFDTGLIGDIGVRDEVATSAFAGGAVFVGDDGYTFFAAANNKKKKKFKLQITYVAEQSYKCN
jgi:hypothetical protein